MGYYKGGSIRPGPESLEEGFGVYYTISSKELEPSK